MTFKNVGLTIVIIAALDVAGAEAQDSAVKVPSTLAARFADMVGHWTINGTGVSHGQSLVTKGVLDCSLVAAGTALMCTGKMKGPPSVPNIKHVHIFGYDPVHKEVRVGVVNNLIGSDTLTGPFTKDGFVISRHYTAPDGDTVKDTQSFTGQIGSGKMKETMRTMDDGKPVVTAHLTWVKEK